MGVDMWLDMWLDDDMNATQFRRYGVQVGDDGRWISEHDKFADACAAASALSSKGLHRAQVVDFEAGGYALFENGRRTA